LGAAPVLACPSVASLFRYSPLGDPPRASHANLRRTRQTPTGDGKSSSGAIDTECGPSDIDDVTHRPPDIEELDRIMRAAIADVLVRYRRPR
jgi:hypothetical protein